MSRIEFGLLTQAAQEVKSAAAAFTAGKKFTGLSHGGKAIDLTGQFGAAWAGEGDGAEAVRVNMTTEEAQAMADAEVLAAAAKDGDTNDALALVGRAEAVLAQATAARGPDSEPLTGLGPVALFLLQVAIKKLLLPWLL